MTDRPGYFEPVRQRASARWDQLENDPELAGPWHQLFKQVQSPRHVLSELLQNADDAGATEAEVEIVDGCFVFIHNGEDFTEEHFASLCRFGYSNKRALHTIGFRGIGFKSTFSLGNIVELESPSLSIAFARQRFTEPRWTDRWRAPDGRTSVRVRIEDEHRQREIEKNLQEWLASPVSLLFFKHIRKIRISEACVHWESRGAGPVSNSEWMAINGDRGTSYMIVRSPEEAFPNEALHEIRQERLLNDEQVMDLPPCRVEIVLGAKGRLYVVLPTGVETELPFACNAPFIQDPARVKIKDPETSPTNRWLLDRVGRLAADSMLEWLHASETKVEDRAKAYAFMPDVDREDSSLEGVCGTIAEESFADGIDMEDYLLSEAGELRGFAECVVLPDVLMDIWPPKQAAAIFDAKNRPPLSRNVAKAERERLKHWGAVDEIGDARVLLQLQVTSPPRPKTWAQLMALWSYLATELASFRNAKARRAVRIVPVQGKEHLCAAREVVRLGEKRLLQSEADWSFLSTHLVVLNPNWPRFLAEQRRGDDPDVANAASEVLRAVGLEDSSDINAVLDHVAAQFFANKGIALASCVQLAQIAAKLGATVGSSFRFVSADRRIRMPDHAMIWDRSGELEAFFDNTWREEHFLHSHYTQSYSACSAEEWNSWANSARSGLASFAPIDPAKRSISGRRRIELEVERRGFVGACNYPYVTRSFVIEDWDFDDAHWEHWRELSTSEPDIWGRVLDRVISQPSSSWSRASNARAVQVATTGNTRAITGSQLLPEWVLKFRDLPCLRDTRGFYHKPCELLRRTAETESLLDVEPFVHAHLDTEANRLLLQLLGVRDTPTGPEHLLDRLRALAKAPKPLIPEIEKWYRRLDHMASNCSTEDFDEIRTAFADERIVLTEDGAWTNATGAFLHGDEEELPDTPLIRASVRDLTLWQKVGVALRPSADLAIQWLKTLPTDAALSPDDVRRVRSYLGRHATRIWHECGHWLNLAGEWAAADSLVYSISMQSLIPWKQLHEGVRRKTADLQKLGSDLLELPPFDALTPLAMVVEERFHGARPQAGSREEKPWLTRFGQELQRIELDDVGERDRIRQLGRALAETRYQTTEGLEVIAYIDGTPAGTPRPVEAVWMDRVLYVENRPQSKLARTVAQELGRAFIRPDISDALKFCFDRPPAFVTDYMEENFRLGPPPDAQSSSEERDPAEDSPSSGAGAERTGGTDDEADEDHEARGADDSDLHDAEQDASHEPEDDEAQDPSDDHEGKHEQPRRQRGPSKPAKPSLIERFATSRGFRFNGDGRYHHPDGGWIAKSEGAAFPWVRHSKSGELLKYYWPKEHCLQREALQLEADAWNLLHKYPETYALILANPNDHPEEFSGARLREMLDQKQITLYPATYRLILDHDHE